MTVSPHALPMRPIGLVATGVALVAMLVGCGSDAAIDSTATPTDVASAGGPAGAPGAMPGTSGEIAAVDGDVLQVRSQMSGQVAVTVTDSTEVTDQAAGTLGDVRAGVCVVVRSAATDDAPASDGGTSTEVDAAAVSVVAAGDDGCASMDGFGGGPGGGPGGARPSDLPSDLPTDRPSGLPDGARMGVGTSGEVTSVTAAGFVVEGPDGDVSVTVGADTAYTKQVAADAKAFKVGRCVRVAGDADDAGAVMAESIQVSDAENDQCGR